MRLKKKFNELFVNFGETFDRHKFVQESSIFLFRVYFIFIRGVDAPIYLRR